MESWRDREVERWRVPLVLSEALAVTKMMTKIVMWLPGGMAVILCHGYSCGGSGWCVGVCVCGCVCVCVCVCVWVCLLLVVWCGLCCVGVCVCVCVCVCVRERERERERKRERGSV